MRFLTDRCAGYVLTQWLRTQGHDVAAMVERGDDPGDEKVLGLANTEGRILITIDKDFGRLAYLDRVAHAGIIRLPDVPAQARIELIRQVIAEFPAGFPPQMVVTISGKRIRISRSPGPPQSE